jgi:citrate synthase
MSDKILPPPMPAGPVNVKNIGLREVYIADTRVSEVEGIRGKIVYRGYTIETLAQHSSFEETAYLLLHGTLPTKAAFDLFDAGLRKERWAPKALAETYGKMAKSTASMDVLQGTIPLLAGYDNELRDESREANIRKAMRLIAKLPAAVAAWARVREGKEPVAPREDLSHAANFLYMVNGEVPDADTAKVFDTCLILHADHQFNASTFTCRVVASTRAHMYASVAAGVGALSGPLHGGANEEVMKMLKEIGDASKLEAWVKATLDKGGRIMGMGHAVYRTMDPRAKILKAIAGGLVARSKDKTWFEMSEKLEEIARREFDARGKDRLHPNVDFYSASVYNAMGIPTDLFTPVFAISRIAGWCSHVIEEKFAEAQPKAALYRPEATYTGPGPDLEGLPYTPPAQRG